MRLIDADKLLEQFEAWEKLDGEYAQSCSNLGRLSGNPRPFNDRVVHQGTNAVSCGV